jgi:hypothetical protein
VDKDSRFSHLVVSCTDLRSRRFGRTMLLMRFLYLQVTALIPGPDTTLERRVCQRLVQQLSFLGPSISHTKGYTLTGLYSHPAVANKIPYPAFSPV